MKLPRVVEHICKSTFFGMQCLLSLNLMVEGFRGALGSSLGQSLSSELAGDFPGPYFTPQTQHCQMAANARTL